MRSLAFVALCGALFAAPASAETVDVKYRGAVDLKPFACTDITRSSFIQRVCYDKAQSYMLINLRGTYYHYCELPPAVLDAFLAAPSMGQFYNQNIKGTGSDGPYDCRTHRVPPLSNGAATVSRQRTTVDAAKVKAIYARAAAAIKAACDAVEAELPGYKTNTSKAIIDAAVAAEFATDVDVDAACGATEEKYLKESAE
ncbi:KTSC domain-containing protein [Bradyrhizobium sp. Pear77]|uniref:KTSC domain-containing protein n=1 Tax=Bradyrhizobium altum TaxID=1571202 RepID=UPI00289FEC0E|nr:KTSC domain-containing protein [Bradyrhizobium altum]MCC8956129.1 KTSC domain-containing protein [Bradyrhizobium altum]